MDEEERIDLNQRLMMVYELPYRDPSIEIDWTAKLLCKPGRTLFLNFVGSAPGTSSGMIAGGTTVARDSFRTLATRDDMLRFVIDWKELILNDRHRAVKLGTYTPQIADGGTLFPVQTMTSNSAKRKMSVEMKYGELFGFLSPLDLRTHLL